MEKKKVKVWKKGFWIIKEGNKVWIKGKYVEEELMFPSFSSQNTNTK